VLRRFIIALAASTIAWVPDSRGGVYSPDEPIPFAIQAGGTAEELAFGPGFEGPFADALGKLWNYADPRPDAVRGSKNPDRPRLLARINERKARPAASPGDAASRAADFLRAGNFAEALNLLAPLSRSRTPDFRVLANLAHAHATRGEWDDAVRWHQSAMLDAEFPTDLPGTTPEQRGWLRRVERDYYAQWLQIHRQRAASKLAPEQEGIFPLFPVKFVNDSGKYEPGRLAANEKAKLPPDAVAIVQQLLLWAPWDTGLYWLLAELYASEGKVQPADAIFFQCANSRQYSNRPELMEHRRVVSQLAEQARREKPSGVPVLADAPEGPPPPPSGRAGGGFLPSQDKVIVAGAVFALLALVLLALQFRAIGRRLRGCGPAG
jgi:tetratricopeptide (TPR) repeat protein